MAIHDEVTKVYITWDKFTKEILKGYCFEFFHQIEQRFRWSVSFTPHKNHKLLWLYSFVVYLVPICIKSFFFLKPCFMSFKQLLWGNRSSVCNCWRYSFWIFFRQRHMSVYPQDIFYPATKTFGHEYGNVGKIFVYFDYACVPLFCALEIGKASCRERV